jgi:hypothetical protein
VRGEVNSKNSYGGYTGFDKFYVDLKANSVVFEGATIRSLNDAEASLKETAHSEPIDDDAPRDGDSRITRLKKNSSRARKALVQITNETKSNMKLWFSDGW